MLPAGTVRTLRPTMPPPCATQVLSLTGSVIYLSSLVSAVAATPLATSTGRKGVMWAMGVLVVAATALGASAGSLGQIFAARAVAGLAVGLGFQVRALAQQQAAGRWHGTARKPF